MNVNDATHLPLCNPVSSVFKILTLHLPWTPMPGKRPSARPFYAPSAIKLLFTAPGFPLCNPVSSVFKILTLRLHWTSCPASAASRNN